MHSELAPELTDDAGVAGAETIATTAWAGR
jgi:hypothetical protein